MTVYVGWIFPSVAKRYHGSISRLSLWGEIVPFRLLHQWFPSCQARVYGRVEITDSWIW